MEQRKNESNQRLDPRSIDLGEVWRPQPQLKHVVKDRFGLEQVNAHAKIAVALSPLPGTPVHVAFSGSQSEGLSIWTTDTRYGFRSVPKISADLIAVRFVNRGFIARADHNGGERVIGYDRALLAPFGAMREERISANFSSITVSVPSTTIAEAHGALIGRSACKLPTFQPFVEVDTVALAALRCTVTKLHHRLANNVDHHDLVTPLMQEVLAYQLISAWPTIDGKLEKGVLGQSDRSIRLAIDFIEANLSRRISILDIATVSGQSVRALQAGFKQAMACSPVEYLILRRLDQVHLALQSRSKQTVKSIAMQWGFVHFSDFGRRYKLRFGFSPGEGSYHN